MSKFDSLDSDTLARRINQLDDIIAKQEASFARFYAQNRLPSQAALGMKHQAESLRTRLAAMLGARHRES